MNQTHIHLFITHLPIFGSMLGAIVLTHGLYSRSNDTKIAAYFLFIISAIGAGVAYLTGEAAEETVEKIPGVVEATIKAHQEFAMFALISLIILGVASLVGLFFTLRKSQLTRTTAFVVLLISLISFGLVARTSYLGGQIRHTEIGNGATVPTENTENEKDED